MCIYLITASNDMIQTHRKICFDEYEEQCKNCGATESVDVHHRDGDRTHNEISNLIPLCKSCHQKVHNGNRDSELMSGLVDEHRENTTPDLDTSNYDVPKKAKIVAKETWEGCYYYYWYWRDSEKVKWEYIGPVEKFNPNHQSIDDPTTQSALQSFT